MTLRYSPAGMSLTTSFEGLRLKAYQDGNGVWTIGYGHTGPDVHAGMAITPARAESYLAADMTTAVATVNRLVTVTLTQGQFDALVDFTYNTGTGSFARSSLLTAINAGDFAAVPAHLQAWDDIDGTPSAGLLRRRQAEAAMFEGKAL
jgi:lysozyme